MNETLLPEESGQNELHISSESNWALFEKIAETLEIELNGIWVEKIDGIDQRYWSLRIDDEVITFHLEHYLGISAFSNSKNLLLSAKQVLKREAL